MQVMKQPNTIQVQPSGAALGADVIGVDLTRTLSETEQETLKQAWADHLVLRFRGQSELGINDLVRFSKVFGDLDQAPPASMQLGDDFKWLHPEITVISNVIAGGKPVGDLGSSEAVWHSDMTYNAKPPLGSALYAVEIPPAGGNTQFANMYLAYDTLDPLLKERIASLRCVHDASRNSAGGLRKGYVDNIDPRETVGATHPFIRLHPVTGKKCLFLGRRRKAYVVGLELEESEALLNELWAHATQSEFVWTQVWQLGDLVLWDNRCTMHRRDSFDPEMRRLLYRTQITGEEVIGAASA